jgi:hypothetical protein
MDRPNASRDADAFLVKRTIPLSNTPAERLDEGVRALRAIEPITDVRVEGDRLRLRYDASCVGLKDIEQLLADAGIVPASGFWWRCKSALYRFLDANARSNALSRGGACCGRPPSPWRGDDT